jgi:hypothetical protein
MNIEQTMYTLEYQTWFNGIGGWALLIDLVGPDSKQTINNFEAIKSTICPLNQIEDIIAPDTPYYFKKWGELDKAIQLIEAKKTTIIKTIVKELIMLNTLTNNIFELKDKSGDNDFKALVINVEVKNNRLELELPDGQILALEQFLGEMRLIHWEYPDDDNIEPIVVRLGVNNI